MNEKPVALVTGASRGIGRGISLELAKIGFRIAGVATGLGPNDRTKGLCEVMDKVEKLGSLFLPIQADIAVLSDHEKIEKAVMDVFGRVDLLVNNAGVPLRKRQDILVTTAESFDQVMNVNLRGTFFLTQRIAHLMISQKRRKPSRQRMIVFITSVSSAFSSPDRAEYCLSKAALSHAAAILADRLADEGIWVYEIRPGIIATDMTEPVRHKYDRQISQGLVPQRRWGTPEDVGRAVAALASGYFPYSTGLVIEVDGGMNIRRLHADKISGT